MRNLWQFLVKYSNLLLFLLLEVVALFFVFSRGGLPHSAWVSSANRVTGSFYQVWDNVTTYFFLRSENERLVAEKIGCGHAIALSCGTAALHLATRLESR